MGLSSPGRTYYGDCHDARSRDWGIGNGDATEGHAKNDDDEDDLNDVHSGLEPLREGVGDRHGDLRLDVMEVRCRCVEVWLQNFSGLALLYVVSSPTSLQCQNGKKSEWWLSYRGGCRRQRLGVAGGSDIVTA